MRPSRFLIVDADRDSAERIGRTLGSVGYRFDSVSTAREALSRVELNVYSAALISDRLSDSDGLDCFARLRRRSPGLAGFLLADACDVSAVFAAVNYGIEHVIQKPVDIDELLRVVSRSSDPHLSH